MRPISNLEIKAYIRLLCWNEVGSLGLEFSTIQFTILTRGLHEAIQMIDSNFLVRVRKW